MDAIPRKSVFVLLIILMSNALSGQEWVLVKSIATGDETPIYIACKSPNLIYYTTFNSSQNEGMAMIVSITDPLGGAQKQKIDSQLFPAQRGYSGIAVTPEGALYFSADGGSPAQSFIKKFTPDGNPDTAFGTDSIIKGTTNRFLGIDFSEGFLFVAIDWGQVLILDGKNGNLLSSVKSPETVYVRDIAINPTNKEIYAVAAASIYKWTDGSPQQPSGYRFVRLHYIPEGKPKSGEGIFFEPYYGHIYATLSLGELGRGLQILSPAGQLIQKIHQLDLIGDCAISPDGDLLFLTAIQKRQIYCFARKGSTYEKLVAIPTLPQVSPAPATTQQPPLTRQWRTNLSASFSEVIRSPTSYSYVAAVFYSPDHLLSYKFLTEILLDEFRSHYPRMLWTKVDIKEQPGFLSSYNIFRVPTIIVFNARGEELLKLINPQNQQSIANQLATLK